MARSEVKKSQKYHTLFEIGVLFFALFFSLTTLSSFLYIVFPINAEQAAAYNFTKLDPADRQLEVQFKTKIYNDGFLSNIHSFANELILVNQDNARKAYKQFHARDMSFTGDEKHNLNAYVNNLFGSSGYPKNPEVEIVAHDHPDQLGVNLLEAITHDENGNKVFSFGTFQNEIYVSESFMIDYIVPFYLREKSISISDYEKQDYSYKYSHIATILDDENFLFPVRTSTHLALDPNLAAEYSYQTAPETDLHLFLYFKEYKILGVYQNIALWGWGDNPPPEGAFLKRYEPKSFQSTIAYDMFVPFNTVTTVRPIPVFIGGDSMNRNFQIFKKTIDYMASINASHSDDDDKIGYTFSFPGIQIIRDFYKKNDNAKTKSPIATIFLVIFLVLLILVLTLLYFIRMALKNASLNFFSKKLLFFLLGVFILATSTSYLILYLASSIVIQQTPLPLLTLQSFEFSMIIASSFIVVTIGYFIMRYLKNKKRKNETAE